MTGHERIEELLAIGALDGLDPDDEAELEREMASHGPACAECLRLAAGFGDVAGRLAFALEPVPMPPAMEERVIAAATAGAAVVPLATRERPAPAHRRARVWTAVVGIAAAFALFAGGWVLRDLTEPTRDEPEPALEGTEVVTFQGEGGSLAVAYRPGEAGVYIFGSGLPAPPQGKVYEVWMIEEDTPAPGPCLTPRADGSLFTYVEVELGTTDTMAVTVEPSSCPSEPTGEPILTADLTAT